MAYSTGIASGHYDLLDKLKVFLTTGLGAYNWIQQRYDISGVDKELLIKAPGLDLASNIYVGLKTYQDNSLDYYNFKLGGFDGYVTGLSFENQPNYAVRGLPLWANPIKYWFTANGQRVIIVTKIENSYQLAYLGYFNRYILPSKYPYPLFIGGMFGGSNFISVYTYRYSDTNIQAFYKRPGEYLVKTPAGWRLAGGSDVFNLSGILPYTSAVNYRNTNNNSASNAGYYALHPMILRTLSDYSPGYINYDILGELDGLYHISGYNNSAENIITVNTENYLVIPNGTKTGFMDYCALRLS